MFAANHFEFVGIFGSFARGEQTEKSDIDILVRFTTRKSLFDLVRIERELSERIGRPVDLVTERALSPYLRDSVLREVKPIYER